MLAWLAQRRKAATSLVAVALVWSQTAWLPDGHIDRPEWIALAVGLAGVLGVHAVTNDPTPADQLNQAAVANNYIFQPPGDPVVASSTGSLGLGGGQDAPAAPIAVGDSTPGASMPQDGSQPVSVDGTGHAAAP